MNDALDHLEAAKLAAVLSGQLRRIDKETESSVPANRIDLRRFQQQVVNSANSHIRPVENYNNNPYIHNTDEEKMLEYLNREAFSKFPEPPPILNNTPVQTYTLPTQSVPNINSEISTKEIPNTINENSADVKINQDSLNLMLEELKQINLTTKEILNFIKNNTSLNNNKKKTILNSKKIKKII